MTSSPSSLDSTSRAKEMLEGRLVNLRRAEKKDATFFVKWVNSREYVGEYQDDWKVSKEQLEEIMLKRTTFFIVEKKEGTEIGHIASWTRGKTIELGYALIPSERGKGYGTEMMQMMVDYLFQNTEVVRIEVRTNEGNIPSQKALERAGFAKEGIMRKESYVRGEYGDSYLYSILRGEWKEAKRLTKD